MSSVDGAARPVIVEGTATGALCRHGHARWRGYRRHLHRLLPVGRGEGGAAQPQSADHAADARRRAAARPRPPAGTPRRQPVRHHELRARHHGRHQHGHPAQGRVAGAARPPRISRTWSSSRGCACPRPTACSHAAARRWCRATASSAFASACCPTARSSRPSTRRPWWRRSRRRWPRASTASSSRCSTPIAIRHTRPRWRRSPPASRRSCSSSARARSGRSSASTSARRRR